MIKTSKLLGWDPNLEPDLVVYNYNAVLNARVKQKQWEGAFWVLQQLEQSEQKPSSTTYGLVMEVVFACEKYNLVHELFRKVKKSVIPSALMYKVLVNTLWREGQTDEAVSAVRETEQTRDCWSCCSLLRPCSLSLQRWKVPGRIIAGKMWDDLEFVFWRMLNHSYHFNEDRHLRIVLEASRARKTGPWEVTWKHLMCTDRDSAACAHEGALLH
ncbi:hypothetical protein MLD38_039253 [Melastoma candidum]|uniref:Uncharacterized protein n=1 Tax=Melastoma candidum TaxID=119954 RepID=A0ACB9L2D6_9MYRT|nr:hypothetical protein MLD38_039253 [Melastoma candidum]